MGTLYSCPTCGFVANRPDLNGHDKMKCQVEYTKGWKQKIKDMVASKKVLFKWAPLHPPRN